MSQDDLDRQLAGVEAELENSTTKPRQWAGAVATAQERQNGGSGRHSRDVNTWLDGVEHAFAPHALASSGDPVEALDPTLDTRRTPRVNTDLNEWLSVVDTSGGARRGHAETALVETAPVATDLGYPWLTETSSDGALTSEESWLSELEASTPAAVRPADAPEPDTVPELGSLSAPNRAASFNGAGLGATIETRPNLGDLMRHLDTFYSGLVQMERRLNSISASYAQVVDRWHPATLDLERKTTRSRPATG